MGVREVSKRFFTFVVYSSRKVQHRDPGQFRAGFVWEECILVSMTYLQKLDRLY